VSDDGCGAIACGANRSATRPRWKDNGSHGKAARPGEQEDAGGHSLGSDTPGKVDDGRQPSEIPTASRTETIAILKLDAARDVNGSIFEAAAIRLGVARVSTER
jgi:hypothetical protein